MKNLWNKLLTEEAAAKAAKHQAHVAKKQATLAALKIEQQERAKEEDARRREEAKLRRDEDKVLRDKREAEAAKKQADLLAHKLAEDKFVEMQETKKAAKVLQRKRAAAKEVEQETRKAARQQDKKSVKRIKAEQAREDAPRNQQPPTVQAAKQQRARRLVPAGAGWPSPPVEAAQRGSGSVHAVAKHSARGSSKIEASHGTGSGGHEEAMEAMIVATVKRLEDKAESEPVVTRQERREQRAEVMDAKKLLQQAAWLREHQGQRAAKRPSQGEEELPVAAAHKHGSIQRSPAAVRAVRAHAQKGAQPAKIGSSTSSPAVQSPGVAQVEDVRRQDGTARDGVIARPAQPAHAAEQHVQGQQLHHAEGGAVDARAQARPTGSGDQSTMPSGTQTVPSSREQQGRAAPMSASNQAQTAHSTATSVEQSTSVRQLLPVQGLPRQREKPKDRVAPAPIKMPPARSFVHALGRQQREKPRDAVVAAPHVTATRDVQPTADVATAAQVATAPQVAQKASAPSKHSGLYGGLSSAKDMEAQIRKENAAEDAKVSDLVKSLTAGDDDDDGLGDGLSDSLRGFSNLQDDSKIQRLRNDDMSAAGITVAAPAEAPADSNGDGSNLGDLLDLMNQPQQPVSSIKPYQLDSHHYSAQDGTSKAHAVTDVADEARKIQEMNKRKDAEIAALPGANAIKRLQKVDAELARHKNGLQKHLALEAKYKAQAEAAQKNMEKLETDNSGMFGLLGALEDAGSAGGALGNIIASGLKAARAPGSKMPDVNKQFAQVWQANKAPAAK